MTTFNETGLSSELLKGIAELGFQEPTPIQAKVIPLLIKGKRDVVALAQTGTGKTAAFGLPLLQLTDPASPAIQALVLCPTRELCLQIAKDLSNFGRFAPQLRILAVYGGSSIQTQMRSLHRGVHILVATPGRLNDLLRRGVARLDGVQRVVLDEADEMLNMGFQEDLETILGEVPDEARTLLFSATMPRQVAAIASKYMDDPEEVIVTAKNSSALKIEHHCHVVHARDRYEVLKRILDCNPDFFGIVFCRTRAETQDLCSGLQSDGYAADALHGDLSQEQRDRVMRQFRVRGVRILVATDVAARGLDVQDITHVIHFDLPGDPDVYTHRSGRTGRAGKSGVSIVLAHMREEGKIRLINASSTSASSMLVPTGAQVCEVRLKNLLEQIRNPPSPPPTSTPSAKSSRRTSRTSPARTSSTSSCSASSAPCSNATRARPTSTRTRPAPRMNAPAPAGSRRRPPAPPRRAGSSTAPTEQSFSIRVNVGKRNGLTPRPFISLINRATPAPCCPSGASASWTPTASSIPANAADMLIGNLNLRLFKTARFAPCLPGTDRRPRSFMAAGRSPVTGTAMARRPGHRNARRSCRGLIDVRIS
ncbi:MAG: DEAD/DEAH box helicase [Kiritimatiellia bacterium]